MKSVGVMSAAQSMEAECPRNTSCVSSGTFHRRHVRSRPADSTRSARRQSTATTSLWCPNLHQRTRTDNSNPQTEEAYQSRWHGMLQEGGRGGHAQAGAGQDGREAARRGP